MGCRFNVDKLPFIGGGTTYRAAFSEAGGLKPGDEVRIAGVKVGKVTGVALEGDHVQVDFEIKGAPEFGTQTGASIRIKTVLGAEVPRRWSRPAPGSWTPALTIPRQPHRLRLRRGRGVQRADDDRPSRSTRRSWPTR